MTFLARAEALARAAHAGQRDLVGEYHFHLERVVALVDGDDAKTVAWLHDILEDTPTTADDLRAAGIPDALIADVQMLTRTPPDVYREYIDHVLTHGSATAKAVKMADVLDHLRPLTPDVLSRKKRADHEAALDTIVRALTA